MVQLVKDLMLSLKWFGSMLCCGFDPWPGNFHIPKEWGKKKKKKKRKREKDKGKINYTCCHFLG